MARYVLALLKKDRPINELRQCMADQLDVFLGQETTQFLCRLFEVIVSEEYVTEATAAENTIQQPSDNNATELQLAAAVIREDKEQTPPPMSIEVSWGTFTN